MSREIQLLDCTLRDGGYINDWAFGHNKLISVYERLVLAGVDIIEVGFLDERRPFDINRSIFPDSASAAAIYGDVFPKAKMTVGMIDFGTCSIDRIEPAKDSFLDGIRVIFKKHLMNEAMDFCAELKAKGYMVFAQLVAVSDYTVEDMNSLIKLVNRVKPYAVSLVDTYGLLYPSTVTDYYKMLDEGVDKEVRIGFHAHNNLQLAYANVLSFLDYETDRNIIVDATLYGMGKSAGNDPIELVAPYMNMKFGTNYDTNPMLEAIDESIRDIYTVSPWGYRTQFYLSSENECHPNYAGYLQGKDNLSVSDINNILAKIDDKDNKKLFYDRVYIEELYQSYLASRLNDDENAMKLREVLADKPLLVIGPGKNIKLQKTVVDEFIDQNKPVTISINYIPDDIDVDYVFVTKKNRYQEMTDILHKSNKNKKVKLIVTSNLTIRETPDFVFDRDPLLEKKEDIVDNSFLMLFRILKKAGIKEVNCAGLDGYSDREDNYYEKQMEYKFVQSQALRLNFHIREVLASEYADMKVRFITFSKYMENDD